MLPFIFIELPKNKGCEPSSLKQPQTRLCDRCAWRSSRECSWDFSSPKAVARLVTDREVALNLLCIAQHVPHGPRDFNVPLPCRPPSSWSGLDRTAFTSLHVGAGGQGVCSFLLQLEEQVSRMPLPVCGDTLTLTMTASFSPSGSMSTWLFVTHRTSLRSTRTSQATFLKMSRSSSL